MEHTHSLIDLRHQLQFPIIVLAETCSFLLSTWGDVASLAICPFSNSLSLEEVISSHPESHWESLRSSASKRAFWPINFGRTKPKMEKPQMEHLRHVYEPAVIQNGAFPFVLGRPWNIKIRNRTCGFFFQFRHDEQNVQNTDVRICVLYRLSTSRRHAFIHSCHDSVDSFGQTIQSNTQCKNGRSTHYGTSPTWSKNSSTVTVIVFLATGSNHQGKLSSSVLSRGRIIIGNKIVGSFLGDRQVLCVSPTA